jgi:hypothetical protein
MTGRQAFDAPGRREAAAGGGEDQLGHGLSSATATGDFSASAPRPAGAPRRAGGRA